MESIDELEVLYYKSSSYYRKKTVDSMTRTDLMEMISDKRQEINSIKIDKATIGK